MEIDLQRTVLALSDALDFVGVDEVHHGKRVALMAAGIARALAWEEARIGDLVYAGVLHDCGVSRQLEHRELTATLEWDGAQAHCLRGEEFLLACPPLARFAPIVRWHHTRWEDLPREGLAERDRLAANLVCLADRTDVLVAPYVHEDGLKSDILWEHDAIVERIAALSGVLFAPDLVAAFRRVAATEAFWLGLDPGYVDDELEDQLRGTPPVRLSTQDALAVAQLFARTVDAKSSYTLEHSTRIARIARHLGEASGIAGEALDQLEIAALLHDIGKLRVPEEIIDKAGPLTREERAIVTRHSYDTGHILRKVFPRDAIPAWAAMHHENLLGTGYPSRSPAADIPQEARLISVADIFQALAQARPYRAPLGREAIMAHLDLLRAQGRIDAGMVELVHTHLARCYALATGAAAT
jgi:HD-GYP domain-containing protein (c-di-GMP phosphodiesterase class II)